MTQIIEKLSTYNIFNFLLPGTLFAYLSKYIIPINLIQEDLFIAFFQYYFFGLVISRIGSIVIEKIFSLVNLIKKEKYENFIDASKSDVKIQLLLEDRNTYRTVVSMFFCLLLLKPIYILKTKLEINDSNMIIICLIVLLIIFSISFIKQNKFISKRVLHYIQSKGE